MALCSRLVLRRHRFYNTLICVLIGLSAVNDLVRVPDLGQVVHVRPGVNLLQHIEHTLLVVLADLRHCAGLVIHVTDEKNPDDLKTVVFQPMLCQHCDNAPCENVCPVAATMHNSEGINQMAYNRCIGTRYCANNCPYKVRRFNWGDYTGASTHGVLGPKSGVGELNEVVYQMNDELTRMVLNPDVVTRSRGVMEKCSFCVQRTQAGKLQAKMENRPLNGDEIQSACAQACPTGAIRFSNVNDKTSTVSQIRENNQQRVFYVLEQIHTLPNVNYLAKIRNTDEVIPPKHGGTEGHAQQQTGEPVTPQHEPAKAH